MTAADDNNGVDEDFRSLIGDVQPLRKGGGRVQLRKPLPPAKPRSTTTDHQPLLADSLSADTSNYQDEILLYKAPGLQNGVMRKLRRGQLRMNAELDLHGLKAEAAALELERFLSDCHDQDLRCLRIIHGKGHRSANGPVIKPLVATWLERRPEVLAFCSARPSDGGSGALYVLIAKA